MPGERSSIGHAAGQVVPIGSLLVMSVLPCRHDRRPDEKYAMPLVTHFDEAVTALVISRPGHVEDSDQLAAVIDGSEYATARSLQRCNTSRSC
jgi:hypothetical protein